MKAPIVTFESVAPGGRRMRFTWDPQTQRATCACESSTGSGILVPYLEGTFPRQPATEAEWNDMGDTWTLIRMSRRVS